MTKRELLELLEPYPLETRLSIKVEDVGFPPNTSFLIGRPTTVRSIEGNTPLVMICGNNAEN